MLLVDAEKGLVLDGNPAAEKLMGYGRKGLTGMERSRLHPESERTRLEDAYRTAMIEESVYEGIHVQRRDGSQTPVAIVSSGLFEAGGKLLTVYALCDMADRARKEDAFLNQNGALAAYAGAASALSTARSAAELLQAVCEAITHQPTHILAWIADADEGEGKNIRTVASAGRALHYLDDLKVSWSEDGAGGKGPLAVCIRTETPQVMADSEAVEIFRPWRERARRAGIRSAMTLPLNLQDGRRGALLVYSWRPNAFDAVVVELFQDLARQIGRGLQAFERNPVEKAASVSGKRSQEQLTEALQAISHALGTAVDTLGPGAEVKLRRVKEIAHSLVWDSNALD